MKHSIKNVKEEFLLKLFSLNGHVALVTGGSKGLGKIIADTLSNAGAAVAICGRNGIDVRQTAAEIHNRTGNRVLPFETDVRNQTQVRQMIGNIKAELGAIDILYANAGINIRKNSEQLSENDWDTIMDTNVKSSFLLAQEIIPDMKKKKWGRIIFMASMLSYISIAGRAAYAASKTALLGLTRTLALELAQYQVCVNALCPGPFATSMNEPLLKDSHKNRQFIEKMPMGRWGHPEELRGIALLLSSGAGSYLTGAGIVVDGGWTAQ